MDRRGESVRTIARQSADIGSMANLLGGWINGWMDGQTDGRGWMEGWRKEGGRDGWMGCQRDSET